MGWESTDLGSSLHLPTESLWFSAGPFLFLASTSPYGPGVGVANRPIRASPLWAPISDANTAAHTHPGGR